MPGGKRSVSDGLGVPLYTLEVPSPHPEIAERTTDLLQDCRYIGSYNWVSNAEKGHPAIVVPGGIWSTSMAKRHSANMQVSRPGSPNVWFDPDLPLKVDPDIGAHIRDNNHHILQGQPLLPILAAVTEQRIFHHEDWKTVDFITDRNGLRNLLRWIVMASGRDFRIDTQLVGNKTVVLNRRDFIPRGHMTGHTFGFNFEKASTVPMPPSTQHAHWHHRIVTYKFGRFRIVVQFEVDACLPQNEATSEEDELVDAMTKVGLASQEASTTTSTSIPTGSKASQVARKKPTTFSLTIHHEGRSDIRHSSLVEMATTSSKSDRFKWNDRYPQLYFSQTGNHHMAKHDGGMFYKINKLNLSSPELQAAHTKLEPAFKKLEAALEQIQSIVTEHGKEERLSLVYEHRSLSVYRNPTTHSCFPAEAMRLFD